MKHSTTAWATSLALAVALAPSIAYAEPVPENDSVTLLATTDLHGTALDYDYFTGAPFGAANPANARGMDRLSTAITEIRTEQGAESVLLLDNGDANQGNPLQSVYHANRAPGTIDPIASLLNHLDYDAGVVGNHEFNYGLEDLGQYGDNLDMPLLGANVIEDATGLPYLDPWTMVTKTTTGGQEIDIAVIGVVTPGVRIWDRLTVQGVLTFEDPVVAVQRTVPMVEAAGADVVVVLAHSGLDATGYEWDPADLEENVAKSIATRVSGIDVIVGGHSHVTNKVQEYYTNPEGDEVLFTQPGYHARFLSNVTIPVEMTDGGEPEVVWTESKKPTAVAVNAADYAQDPAIEGVIAPWHDQTLAWVSQVVAQATETMSAATSVHEDTAIVDFISRVQTDEVKRAFAGTDREDLPIVSAAAPFSRTAVFNEGDVTVADMAALYIYDNTLMAVELTGAQLRDYLEYSARYYAQMPEDTVITDWDEVTNALYPGETRGIPDYAYDILSGVDYHINISLPVGERIENLTYPDGTPVGDTDRIALVLNNYRQSGGSGYPHVVDAPIIYNEQKAIRDLMIDWAIESGVIDPADFFVKNWTVSASTTVVEPEPEPEPEPLRGNVFFLSDDWTSTTHSHTFAYGRAGDEVLVGDWDGDGYDTLGVRRGNAFYLTDTLRGGAADHEFRFGRAHDEVLVGNWDGTAGDTLAVRRGNTYYLMNDLKGGAADIEFNYGRTSDEALAGDWDGDRSDTIAVRRDTTFFVVNEPRGGNADVVYNFGRSGDRALAGDFDGDGTDTISLVRGNMFYINNSHRGGVADTTLTFGRIGDAVMVGDWNGDGVDTPGVNRVV